MTVAERTQCHARELVFEVTDEMRRGKGDDAIPVVVSTDAVVEVEDGPEILQHTDDAIDLRRAPLPIVATHQSGQVNVGLVDSLRVVGGQLRGMARFGARPEAAGYKTDVLNGIIRSVSVRYIRVKARLRHDGVLLTQRWIPTHVAMVAEPADVGAGFYRSAHATPAFELEAELATPNTTTTVNPAATAARPKEQSQMDETTQAAAGENAESQAQQGAQQAQTRSAPAQPRQGPSAMEMETERRTTIENLCRASNIDEGIRSMWISSGASARAVSDDILQIVAERAKNTPKTTQVGLSEKETRRFSLSRAIEACAAQNWTNAGFEAEVSREVQRRVNRAASPNRFFVPWEVQERQNMTPMEAVAYSMMKRDLTVASAGGGGYLKETVNVGFIELLRNKSVLMNMGAMRLSGLQGDVTVPKQTATGSATWLANEAATITEINQTFGQMALTPKTVGGYTEISRQLLLQSNPYVEGLVMTDLATVVALDVDLKGLNGSGAGGQPTGILQTAGIGAVTGTSLDYADLVEFQTDVFAGNALTGNSGYVTTGAVAGLLKSRVKFSGTASPLWDGRLDMANVDGYRGMGSNQMPAATMLFGDFGLGVVIAEWGVLEVEVNPYANFQAGIVGVRAIASIDIGVRYPTAFSAASSIT